MFDKIDVRLIIRRHYLTLYSNRSGKPSWADKILFFGFPVVTAVLSFATGLRLSDATVLLAGVTALAAFLFALLILVLQMSADTASASDAGSSKRLLRRVRILQELAANVAYSVIVAIGATMWLALGEFLLPARIDPLAPEPRQSTWYSATVLAILVHLVLTLLMVVKRTFAITERELDYASVPIGRD